MRFKKGSKVEVMRENNLITSWACAEIVSDNGQTYLVKFDHCLEFRKEEAFFERVSEKVIRPRPPPPSVEDIELLFVAGDVVEVLNHGSWLPATILNVLNKDYYSVRLLASSNELRIPRSRIRARISWEHEKWVKVGQGSRKNQHFKPDLVFRFKRRQLKNDFLPVEDIIRFRKKLDHGVAEKGKHYSSFNDNDDTCSVGSCSVVTSGNRKNYSGKRIGAKIRSLEKYAYRSTLGVLYAKGALSWEQEALLTNLRRNLRISNDEHLVELKNLMSSGRHTESDTESIA